MLFFYSFLITEKQKTQKGLDIPRVISLRRETLHEKFLCKFKFTGIFTFLNDLKFINKK